MDNYYAKSLNATGLYRVYQTEIEGVKRYLQGEIAFVRDRLHPGDAVLELGAGYGRVMKQLAPSARLVHGIDIAENTVALGQDYLLGCQNCRLTVADVYTYDNIDVEYDAVLCLQNGLSAFKGDSHRLVEIALGLLKMGGRAYFSSYSEGFWDTRLAWFQEQADKGLLGEIDYKRTGGGNIVCKDGFTATTFTAADMEALGEASGQPYTVQEVDGSSVFLVMEKVS